MSEDYLDDMDVNEVEVNEEFDGFEDNLQDEELVNDGPSVYSEGGDCEDSNLDEAGEYEEITSDEVDRVVETLESLAETVESENIKVYLEDAVNSIHGLIYEKTELESGEDEENEDLSQVA